LASHTLFFGVAKKSVVCVTRLTTATTTETVSNHLTTNGIYVLCGFDVSPDGDELKFRSMRVCIYSLDLVKHYDSNLWLLGVVVRPWKFKSES